MALTAETWPIAASLLPFTPDPPTGAERDSAAVERWNDVFLTVSDAGFDTIDLTDTWVPFGDLSPGQRVGMRERIDANGLAAASLSVIRRSVTDEQAGEENLAYSHRCIDLAAEWGVGVVSVGLHRPLNARQRAQLWFRELRFCLCTCLIEACHSAIPEELKHMARRKWRRCLIYQTITI